MTIKNESTKSSKGKSQLTCAVILSNSIRDAPLLIASIRSFVNSISFSKSLVISVRLYSIEKVTKSSVAEATAMRMAKPAKTSAGLGDIFTTASRN